MAHQARPPGAADAGCGLAHLDDEPRDVTALLRAREEDVDLGDVLLGATGEDGSEGGDVGRTAPDAAGLRAAESGGLLVRAAGPPGAAVVAEPAGDGENRRARALLIWRRVDVHAA